MTARSTTAKTAAAAPRKATRKKAAPAPAPQPQPGALRTECGKGHPLSGDNLYILPSSGHRRCKICRAEIRRAYRQSKRATAASTAPATTSSPKGA